MSFNLDSIKASHNQLAQRMKDAAVTALNAYGKLVKAEVRATTSFGGTKLRRRVKIRKVSRFIRRATIGGPARFLNDGTQPHTIRPKNKRWLHFQGRKGPVFAKLVNHPGNKATGFFDKANHKAWRISRQLFRREVNHAITTF